MYLHVVPPHLVHTYYQHNHTLLCSRVDWYASTSDDSTCLTVYSYLHTSAAAAAGTQLYTSVCQSVWLYTVLSVQSVSIILFSADTYVMSDGTDSYYCFISWSLSIYRCMYIFIQTAVGPVLSALICTMRKLFLSLTHKPYYLNFTTSTQAPR